METGRIRALIQYTGGTSSKSETSPISLSAFQIIKQLLSISSICCLSSC